MRARWPQLYGTLFVRASHAVGSPALPQLLRRRSKSREYAPLQSPHSHVGGTSALLRFHSLLLDHTGATRYRKCVHITFPSHSDSRASSPRKSLGEDARGCYFEREEVSASVSAGKLFNCRKCSLRIVHSLTLRLRMDDYTSCKHV